VPNGTHSRLKIVLGKSSLGKTNQPGEALYNYFITLRIFLLVQRHAIGYAANDIKITWWRECNCFLNKYSHQTCLYWLQLCVSFRNMSIVLSFNIFIIPFIRKARKISSW